MPRSDLAGAMDDCAVRLQVLKGRKRRGMMAPLLVDDDPRRSREPFDRLDTVSKCQSTIAENQEQRQRSVPAGTYGDELAFLRLPEQVGIRKGTDQCGLIDKAFVQLCGVDQVDCRDRSIQHYGCLLGAGCGREPVLELGVAASGCHHWPSPRDWECRDRRQRPGREATW